MNGNVAYALSKNYTNLVAVGISSATVDNVNKTITFTLVADGSQHTIQFDQPDDGVSVVDLTVNADNHLICIMSDNSEIDAGELPSYEPVLTEALSPNVTMGSLKTSYPVGTSLEEIIRDMLTEKIPPVTAMTLNPSTLLYDEVSGSIPTLTINATITKKTNDVAKVEFYINNTLVHTVSSGITSGGSVPYIYNTVIDDDAEIKVVVTDTENLVGSAKKNIVFCGQSYYGIIDPTIGTATETLIKTLNKTLKNTNDFVYSGITCDYNKLVYAYPQEFGKLTQIADVKNSFNYMESFECQSVTIDNIPYYAYVLLEATGVDGAEITFK